MKSAYNATIALAAGCAAFVATGCPGQVRHPAPIEDGSLLLYNVLEVIPDRRETYQIKYAFKKRGSGFNVELSSKQGKRSAVITADARVIEGSLDMPFVMADAFTPGPLYLAPPARRAGVKLANFGQVVEQKKWKQWQVWEVQTAMPAMGTVLYEQSTGMMVGWVQTSNGVEMEGVLVESR